MKVLNISSDEAAPVLLKCYDNEFISRCPNCNLICSLKINNKEGKPMIYFECENQHKGNILLKDYLLKYNKFCLSKEKCKECGKEQKEIKGNFMYCSKCDIFICNLCIGNHLIDDSHNIINLKKYDSLCKIHSNPFCFYCIKCKQNLCIYCKNNHKSHGLIDLSELKYSQSQLKKLEYNIYCLESKINNLNEIKQKIVSFIDSFKSSSELQLKFFKILLNTYQYEEQLNNLNFHVIQNLKNLENILMLDNIELYDQIYNEGNKYLLYLQNLNNNTNRQETKLNIINKIDLKTININKKEIKLNDTIKKEIKVNNINKREIKINNFLKNNFKTLKIHKDSISYISKLKDGRLISCSWDNSLNIYNKNSYELELSIKEHSECVRSFTQLINGKIITCSNDGTMKVIKLIEDNKYKVEQTLFGHNDWINKIIEINENTLISVSYDKTMKIWKLNDDNEYSYFKSIFFQNTNSFCNIYKLNQNEFITLSKEDKCLKFWDSNNYFFLSKINYIETCAGLKTICLLDNNVLCIAGTNSKGFYLINISTHQFIKYIIGPEKILSIIKCLDGLFLCCIIDENKNNSIVKYKYENQNFIKMFQSEKNEKIIYSCVELNKGIFALAGNNTIIKLMKD